MNCEQCGRCFRDSEVVQLWSLCPKVCDKRRRFVSTLWRPIVTVLASHVIPSIPVCKVTKGSASQVEGQLPGRGKRLQPSGRIAVNGSLFSGEQEDLPCFEAKRPRSWIWNGTLKENWARRRAKGEKQRQRAKLKVFSVCQEALERLEYQ